MIHILLILSLTWCHNAFASEEKSLGASVSNIKLKQTTIPSSKDASTQTVHVIPRDATMQPTHVITHIIPRGDASQQDDLPIHLRDSMIDPSDGGYGKGL